WRAPSLPEDLNEQVTVVEYWNDNQCAATVGDELLYVNDDNGYGFVPLSEAHFMDSPLADAKWSFQSVLAPIMDTLKTQFILVSKMAAGVDLYYWPTILVVDERGELRAYEG